MVVKLIGFGFFFLASHLILLEVFKKKLKEEFPVIYKELDSPPFSTLKDESTQSNFYKGDTPQLEKFLRKREFLKIEDTSLKLLGYFILATKLLVYISLVSLLIVLFVP